MEIVSNYISEPPAAYVRRRTMRLLFRWLWLIVLVLSATLVAAMSDSRFLYVLLIELLVVFPMALGPVWLFEAMSADARRAVIPHRLRISSEGIAVDYKTEEDRPPVESEKFLWSDFSSYHDAGKYVILKWATSKREPLRIPESAFDSERWLEAADILAQHL